MHDPLGRVVNPFDSPSPLSKASFLADVYLLSTSDKSNNHGPRRNPGRELDEVFRFGLARGEVARAGVLLGDLFGIECSLRFVEHENVLARNHALARGMASDVFLNATNEGLAITAGSAQFILQDLDQRPVTRQEHSRSGRLPAPAVDGEIVDEVRVNGSQPLERLAGSGHAG